MGSFLTGATSLCGLLLFLTLANTQDIPTAGGENDRCFIHVSGGTEVCFYDPDYPGFECTNMTNKYPSYPSCRLWGACYTPMAEDTEVCYYLHGYGYQCYFKYDEKIIANMTNCNDLKANSPPEIRVNYGGQPTIVVNEDELTLSDWITITDADAQQSEIDGDGYIRISMAVTNGYIGFDPSLVALPAEQSAAEDALNPDTNQALRANFEGGKNGSLTDSLAFTIRTGPLSALMKSFVFITEQHFNEAQGTSVLTVDVDDQGNTGGTPESTSETITIKATQVNDAPVVTMEASYATNEDVSVLLTGISVSDVDSTEPGAAFGGVITVTASVPSGTGTLSFTGGIAGCGIAPCVSLSGDSKTLTLHGLEAQINLILDTLTFVPSPDASGSSVVRISADDRGQTGTGGNQVTTVDRTVTISPVNDKPVITTPVTYTADEDAPLAGFAGTTVSDVDHTTGLNLTLEVSNGLLSHPGFPTGQVLHLGDATIAEVNSFFGALTYQAVENFNGLDSVVITVSDSVESETVTVPIDVLAVNDPPVLEARCAPMTPCTSAELNLTMQDMTFAANDAAATTTAPYLHFTDLDATASDHVLLVLSVDEGLLTLPPGSFSNTIFTLPADIPMGTNPGSHDTFYLLAPKSDVNLMLAGLQYTNPGATFPDSLDVMISDLGLTGKGEIGNTAVVINYSVVP